MQGPIGLEISNLKYFFHKEEEVYDLFVSF